MEYDDLFMCSVSTAYNHKYLCDNNESCETLILRRILLFGEKITVLVFLLTITLLQVFYEVMCFVILLDILNPKIKCDSLTMIKWLAKSFCKVPFYMELVVNYHKLLMYLALTYLLLINFYPCYLFLHLLIDEPNMFVIVSNIFILTVSVESLVKFYTPGPPTFVIPFSFAFICTEIIIMYILCSGILLARNASLVDVLWRSPFSLLDYIFGIGIGGGIGGVMMYLLFEVETALSLSLVNINKALTNIWKSFSIFSIIIYIIKINIHFLTNFSYIPIALSILVIGLLYLIVLNYKSVYAIALIIILFVSYNIIVLYKLWSSNSSVFLISQATSQLTIVGALLHATGYTKLWKNTAD